MFLHSNTLRATSAVCLMLVLAFVVTGFAGSAYRRERTALGLSHFEDAQALESRRDLEGALEEYRKALLFSPDKTEYQVSLATALIAAGHLDEAQSHLEQLVQREPTNGMINLLLARVAVQRREWKDAANLYQRAVYEYWPTAQIPQRRRARWELAMLLNQTGDRTGFVAELMQLYTNLPSAEIDQKLRVGFLLATNGVTSEASQIFHDIAKEEPRNAEAHRGLGEIALSSADFISARHEFQRALRLNPEDHDSARELAIANDAIDIDPALPNISAGERLHRSRNLLSKIMAKIETCSGTLGPLSQPQPPAVAARTRPGDAPPGSPSTPVDLLSARLRQAADLLNQKSGDADDLSNRLQTLAAQLWQSRSEFCKGREPADAAVDLVLARINNE